MRFEHRDPDDAVQIHEDLRAARSFGVHWGTFQLGDEEPFEPARDLSAATRRRSVDRFGLVPLSWRHAPTARSGRDESGTRAPEAFAGKIWFSNPAVIASSVPAFPAPAHVERYRTSPNFVECRLGPTDRNRTCICRLGGGRSIH